MVFRSSAVPSPRRKLVERPAIVYLTQAARSQSAVARPRYRDAASRCPTGLDGRLRRSGAFGQRAHVGKIWRAGGSAIWRRHLHIGMSRSARDPATRRSQAATGLPMPERRRNDRRPPAPASDAISFCIGRDDRQLGEHLDMPLALPDACHGGFETSLAEFRVGLTDCGQVDPNPADPAVMHVVRAPHRMSSRR